MQTSRKYDGKGLTRSYYFQVCTLSAKSYINCLIRYYGRDFEADIINRVEELAQKKGASMAQVALKWVLNQKGVVAPVIGSTKPSQLDDLVGTFKV